MDRTGPPEPPPIVHEVLRSPGQPLDPATRAFMEPRFGHDFGQVRVHTDARAAESTRAVNALAYTVGRNIVFAQGHYRPAARSGRRLLAHELAHVVQQRDASESASAVTLDSPHSMAEREAQRMGAGVAAGGSAAAGARSAAHRGASAPIVSRADPQAVALTLNLGRTVGTGLQFWPTTVTDTRVGPVTVGGGLAGTQTTQLNVVIGENLTPRTLARQLLPLWTTATPFTPTGAAAPVPLDVITEEELAQGLLVYNQYYLPVPAMTNWRSGLRFPLPVEVDTTTGVATLNPTQVKLMAGAFNAAWMPFLDQRASATTAPPAATVAADVTAFLARETTALARGVHLGTRALTNAVAELPFIREAFRQLGAGAFDVALAFMDNLVNRQIELLAAQRDGADILAEIRAALAAAPAVLTADRQASLDRANLMLGLVAGVAAVAPPSATRARAEKTVSIDTVKLDGSNHDPATDVAVTNGVYAQCNVRLIHGVNATATNAETTTWLGGDTDLRASAACGSTTAEERRLFQGATTRFGLSARIRAFYPPTVSNGARAYSFPPFCATGAASVVRGMANITNLGNPRTLAHEVGHILLNSGAHPTALTSLMGPAGPLPQGESLSNPQCTTIYNNA